MQNLDNDLAILIELLYFSGHTQAEASKILGIPLGTIKSRARKALSDLAGHLRALVRAPRAIAAQAPRRVLPAQP